MIHFDYKLRSVGWARATIADEHAEISVPASYLCDALRDFVDAVQRVFGAESTECIWEEEPGQICWKFRRSGMLCTVEVFSDNQREAIFSGNDDLLHFSSEVEGALQKLLDEWGEERYFEQWGYSFPQEELARLSYAIRMERNQREPTNQAPSSDN